MILKKSIIVMLLSSLAILSWAHGVKVIKPDSESQWHIGKKYNIQWEIPKSNVKEVKIVLRITGKKEGIPIVDVTKNTGNFFFDINDRSGHKGSIGTTPATHFDLKVVQKFPRNILTI